MCLDTLLLSEIMKCEHNSNTDVPIMKNITGEASGTNNRRYALDLEVFVNCRVTGGGLHVKNLEIKLI